MKKNLKIVIFGASGAIGSSIANILFGDDRFDIINVSRNNDGIENTNNISWDFLNYNNEILALLESANVIINAVGQNNGEDIELEKINFLFVQSIINKLIKLNSSVRFIQISSAGAYGAIEKYWPNSKAIDEAFEDFPGNFYEYTKAKADKMIMTSINNANNKISYTIIRPTNVLSKSYSNLYRYVNYFFNKRFYILLRKDSLFTFVSVNDLAKVVKLCILNLKKSHNQMFIVSDDCLQENLYKKLDKELHNTRINIIVPFFMIFFTVKLLSVFKITQPFARILKVLTSKISYNSDKIRNIDQFACKSFTSEPKKFLIK
tara:strand:- start:6559 stop:7515 length:957 start_codon:yes stop_codon:yes gene_type:complete